MVFKIEKATKAKQKLRLALSGPSGSGKTYSALLLAKSLGAKNICVIDTERGSASLYADIVDFNVIELQPLYSPDRYIEAITAAEESGADCIIVDSITQEWNGEGGCLEMVNKVPGNNSYTAWGKITPKHNAFVSAMLNCKSHLIVTMRAKTAYVLEENEKGKMAPRKKGMEPQQRDGMEYEFTTMFEIDHSHNFTASKDRTAMFNSDIPEPLNGKVGQRLLEWLNSGVVKAKPVAEPVVEAEPVEVVKTYKEVAADLYRKITDDANLTDIYKEFDALKPHLDKTVIDHIKAKLTEVANNGN